MSEHEIEKIREKYPVEIAELNLYSSFEQILGKKCDHYSHEERKKRWEKMMSLNKNMKKYWNDSSECIGCAHLSGYWCNYSDLPCTVNPVLSFKYGIIAMACCGLGILEREPLLFDNFEELF